MKFQSPKIVDSDSFFFPSLTVVSMERLIFTPPFSVKNVIFIYFIYFKKIYLFIYLVALGLSCGTRAP